MTITVETKNLVGPLVVGVILTALAAVGVVLWRLELHMLYTLALILVIGAVVALIIAAAAFPLRARQGQQPHERERIIKETKHTIRDGRHEPRIITLQGSGPRTEGIYPEILRGILASDRRLPDQREGQGRCPELVEGTSSTSVVDGEVTDVESKERESDAWSGPIRRERRR